MPTVASKLASNPRAVVALATTLAGLGLYVSVRRRLASKRKDEEAYIVATQDKVGEKRKGDRAAVDWEFLKRILRLFKILVPRVLCPETGYLIMVAFMLVLRTYADVWMIQNGTSVEGSIIGRNFEAFKKYVLSFLYAMPFISLVNITLKYSLQELQLRFRSRLSLHLYKQYMRGFTFYKMSNLDNRIANADQLLTQDVEKFCATVTELYSNISKPILDICLYFYQLSSSIGAEGPLIMLLYLAFSGLFLTKLRTPVGRMTVKEQQLEGTLRYVNSRVITNSEEISFYQGNNRERLTIEETFKRLVHHLRSVIHFRFAMGFIDNLTAKYFATVVGYMVVSRPFLNLANPRHLHSSHHQIMLDYYRSGRMLVRMSEAIGRLVLAGRDMARLSGFTARIHQLTTVLRDLHKGRYVRTMVNTSNTGANGTSTSGESLVTGNSTDAVEGPPLVPGSGEIIEVDNLIKFEHVPLVTPNGDVLLRDMNFEVHSGMNVLVCGPNGCGKSSLFRILGELWPLFGGRLVKPHKSKLFYIPQRPYMTLGMLRDQVIYPDTHEEQMKKGISDEVLEEYLTKVQLKYLLEREGGWNAIQDWMDVLSGGEKQRMAMARLFYHQPQFAILDECTSAVSVDVEGYIYTHCREKGITLFTVSHRKSLWQHHEYVMQFDGRGTYEFKKIDSTTEEFGS